MHFNAVDHHHKQHAESFIIAKLPKSALNAMNYRSSTRTGPATTNNGWRSHHHQQQSSQTARSWLNASDKGCLKRKSDRDVVVVAAGHQSNVVSASSGRASRPVWRCWTTTSQHQRSNSSSSRCSSVVTARSNYSLNGEHNRHQLHNDRETLEGFCCPTTTSTTASTVQQPRERAQRARTARCCPPGAALAQQQQPQQQPRNNNNNSMTSDASELGMNVAALKRVDPYVKDILEQATHVALYTFNADNNEWEKTDIEGALFVYSRIGEPYHSILIMNRLSTKNQVEPVTPGLDLQLQEPFLLYKNAKGHIYGIWFYDKDECIRISSMLNKLTKNSDSTNKVTPKTKKPVQKKTNNVDIFSMLSKAQEDFNSHKGGNDERNTGSMNPKSPMSNAIGELSGALTAMGMTPDGTSKSVMDFFAKATVNKTPSNPEGRTLLERLMSHPTAHTVENIEKQHGSVTPQPTVPSQPQNVRDLLRMNNQSSDNSLLTKLKSKMPNQTNVHPQTTPKMFSPGYSHQMSDSRCRGMELPLNADATTNSSGFLRIQSPTTTGPNKLMSQVKSDSVTNFVGAYEPVSIKKQNPVPGNSVPFDALFQHNQTNNVCEELISPSKSSALTSSAAPALIPPGMFAAPSPATTAEPLIRPLEPLTRNQLLQAFNYLLRTDQEFVNKLHEAYVKSMSEILS